MFKVGDEVVCVNKGANAWITDDNVYRVIGIEYDLVYVFADDQREHGYMPHRFRLAPTTAARSTDPDTSKKAAIKAKRTPLRVRIDQYLCVGMSATGTDIATALGAKLNSVTPRFAELRSAGIIKDSGKRRDGQIVWVRA